jgi:hypothetical protein
MPQSIIPSPSTTGDGGAGSNGAQQPAGRSRSAPDGAGLAGPTPRAPSPLKRPRTTAGASWQPGTRPPQAVGAPRARAPWWSGKVRSGSKAAKPDRASGGPRARRPWAPGRAPASLHMHTCTVKKQTCMQLGNKYCDNHKQSRKIQIYTYPLIIDCYVRPGSTKSLGPPLDRARQGTRRCRSAVPDFFYHFFLFFLKLLCICFSLRKFVQVFLQNYVS